MSTSIELFYTCDELVSFVKSECSKFDKASMKYTDMLFWRALYAPFEIQVIGSFFSGRYNEKFILRINYYGVLIHVTI